VHPGYRPITKYYGYVENAADQIATLAMEATEADVCGRVYYVTDPPIDSANWMRGFSIALAGKDIRRVPLPIWRLLATVGDCFNYFGIGFPMSSARFFRLTVSERLPYERTRSICGSPRISLEEGIRRSVEWYLATATDPNTFGTPS
jgi:nucleoside-diphosphate-sugar epimerase